MPRHKLEFDPPDEDFLLFGICSQSKDYRLVWIINKHLKLRLKRKEDISPDAINHFSCYFFEDEEERIKYHLSSAKSKGAVFMKELKQIDYLLIIKENYESVDADIFLSELKRSETVLAAYRLNPDILKSKQYLFFE